VQQTLFSRQLTAGVKREASTGEERATMRSFLSRLRVAEHAFKSSASVLPITRRGRLNLGLWTGVVSHAPLP
jgi:hypothetical protein